MKIINDEFMVCLDCLQIIAYDDPSSLDYTYGDRALERYEKIRKSIEEINGTIGVIHTQAIRCLY